MRRPARMDREDRDGPADSLRRAADAWLWRISRIGTSPQIIRIAAPVAEAAAIVELLGDRMRNSASRSNRSAGMTLDVHSPMRAAIAPPAVAMTMLSIKTDRTRRRRLTPRATRMEVACERDVARLRRNELTFTHAMKKTSAVAKRSRAFTPRSAADISGIIPV